MSFVIIAMKKPWLGGFFFALLLNVGICKNIRVWEFGHDDYKYRVISDIFGTVNLVDQVKTVKLNVRPGDKVAYLKVSIKNFKDIPTIIYDQLSQTVTIEFQSFQYQPSSYRILAKGLKANNALEDEEYQDMLIMM